MESGTGPEARWSQTSAAFAPPSAPRDRLLLAAMQTSPDAFIVLDHEDRVEWWNRAAEKLFGWSVGEAVGQPLTDLVVPEQHKKAHDEGLRRRAAGGRPRLGVDPVQVEAVCRDGRSITVELSVGELEWDGGRRFHAFVRDVTDRESARRALELSENRSRMAFENAPVGMLLTEVGAGEFGRVIWANPAAEAMLGYRQDDLRMITCIDITHPDDVALDREMVPRLLVGELNKLEYEKRFLRPEGSEVWVAFSATIVREHDGSPKHGIHQLVDISQRRSAAHELVRLNEQLRQANAELAAANAELDGFTAAVAHDLRSPLTAIMMHAGLLLELAEDRGFALPGAETIARAAQRMDSLIEDLLVYSRAERIELRREPVALDAMVDDVACELRAAAGHPIRITRDSLPSLHLEPILFRQVVTNVMGNAAKYVAPGVTAHVHVSAEHDPTTDAWTLRFADNGIGIAPEVTERVFDVFHREAVEYPGTGVGLATCRRVVERHGGCISIAAGPSGGSVVSVTIPPSDR